MSEMFKENADRTVFVPNNGAIGILSNGTRKLLNTNKEYLISIRIRNFLS